MGETRRGEESQKGEVREAEERAAEDLGRGEMGRLGEEAGEGAWEGRSGGGKTEVGGQWASPGVGGRRDQAGAGPLTEAGSEVRAGAVPRRTDALEGAVGVGTDAALAKVLLAALVHVCGTGRPKARPTSPSA